MKIERTDVSDDADYVVKRLVEYNESHISDTTPRRYEHVNLVVRNERGDIVAGLLAVCYWDCIQIDVLWVDDSLRGQGYGTGLLREVEQIAHDRKCHVIELNTFSFQAPEWYKRHGYEVIGIVNDAPRGHKRYYMVKHLTV